MKLSVVIPTYNEEAAMAGNVEKIIETLKTYAGDYELILVNDGSTDKTLERMKELAANFPKIKIVSYAPNRGRGFALRQGFAAANSDYIVATESDLNWGSDIITRLAKRLETGDCDIATASPHMRGGGMENVPFFRWFLSWAGNKVFSLVFPGRFTMVTGMTRGYKSSAIKSLKLESDDKELHVEIISKALDAGFKITEIPATLRWKKPKPGELMRKSHFKWRSIFSHIRLAAKLFARYYLFYLAKLALTILVLWLLFKKVDFLRFWAELRSISFIYFLAGVLVLTLSWFISSFKWQRLLKIFNFNIGLGSLFSYNLISIFYNIVLPGGKVAGDAIRAYRVSSVHGSDTATKKELALLTFLDRGLVLLALASFSAAYFLFGLSAVRYLELAARPIGLALFAAVLLGWLLIFSGILDFVFLGFADFFPRWSGIPGLADMAFTALRFGRARKNEMFKALLISFVSVLVSAFSLYILSVALGAQIDFWTTAFFNSLAVILIAIPVTVAGIGVREGGLVYLFFQYGLSLEKATALAALNLAIMLVLALAGGMIECYFHFLKKNHE